MGFSHDLLDYRANFDGNRILKKPAKTCLVLHKKSCTRPEVKAAVKQVRQSGVDVDVYIPWSRKDLRRFVRQAIKEGAQRIVAGGGDGTLNAVVNAMISGDKRPKASLGILPLGTANDFAKGAGIDAKDLTSRLIYDPQEWDIGEDEAIAKMEAELDRLVAGGKIREADRNRVAIIKDDCLSTGVSRLLSPEDRLRRHDLRKTNSATGISACR